MVIFAMPCIIGSLVIADSVRVKNIVSSERGFSVSVSIYPVTPLAYSRNDLYFQIEMVLSTSTLHFPRVYLRCPWISTVY